MGRDKATLVFEGERLVDRAVRRLAELCTEVLVASGDGRRLDVAVTQVADPIVAAGPLAGIAAGLSVASSPAVAVVAVDAPFVDLGVLTRCAERLGDAVACIPEVGGVLQPLHGVWATSAAAAVRDALDAGERSPWHLAETLGAVVLPEVGWRDVAVAGGTFATSWNRPADVGGAVAGYEGGTARSPLKDQG